MIFVFHGRAVSNVADLCDQANKLAASYSLGQRKQSLAIGCFSRWQILDGGWIELSADFSMSHGAFGVKYTRRFSKVSDRLETDDYLNVFRTYIYVIRRNQYLFNLFRVLMFLFDYSYLDSQKGGYNGELWLLYPESIFECIFCIS